MRRRLVRAARWAQWEAGLWQLRSRRRLRRLGPLRRLPFGGWARLAAPDARSMVSELGRRHGGDVVFVQVGANDGVSNDPLFDTVRRWRWRGVLVEPLPGLFDRLVLNYAGADDLAFENVAIGEASDVLELFTVQPRPGDPEWVTQLASFDRRVVLRHCPELPDLVARIQPVRVPAVRLPDLVARHGLERVDLLHVDTEGYDLHVLDQIELGASWAPRYVLFEKKHLAAGDYRRCYGRFARAGYRRVRLWPDELWYRPGTWAGTPGPVSTGADPEVAR